MSVTVRLADKNALVQDLETLPILYKYFEVKDFLPKILNGESLRFSCPFDFNDPFESRYCYQVESTDAGKKFIRDAVKSKYTNPSQRIAEAQRLKNRFRTPQSLESDVTFDYEIRRVGVCCFSELHNSILMWSHYANEHKGICIGFNTQLSLFQFAFQIAYKENFPIIIRPSDNPEAMLEKSLLTKSIDWSYEKEWRIIKRTLSNEERSIRTGYKHLSSEEIQLLIDETVPGDYCFDKKAISEVYLGARMEQKQRETIVRMIKNMGLKIPIFQARRNPKKYSLEFSRVNK